MLSILQVSNACTICPLSNTTQSSSREELTTRKTSLRWFPMQYYSTQTSTHNLDLASSGNDEAAYEPKAPQAGAIVVSASCTSVLFSVVVSFSSFAVPWNERCTGRGLAEATNVTPTINGALHIHCRLPFLAVLILSLTAEPLARAVQKLSALLLLPLHEARSCN